MTRQDIAALLDVPDSGAGASAELLRVDSFAAADGAAIVFAQDEGKLAAAVASPAGLILGPVGSGTADDRVLEVADPRLAFAICGQALRPAPLGPRIHPTAVIDPTARVAETARVGAGAVIGAGASVGDGTVIGPRVVIGERVSVGCGCVIQAGAVIGSNGFGYAWNPLIRNHLLTPQIGTVSVENDVEIGANTTIDRGALGETRIGAGTKIDNLVHIAHNCVIGRNVLIAAQVGIAGSTVVEDGAVLAGQVGLGDHVRVGKGVIMGGQSGIYPGAAVDGPGKMFAGTPAEPVRDHLKSLARLRRLK